MDDLGREDGTKDYTSEAPAIIDWTISIIGYMQGVTASTMLIGYCMNSITLIVRKGWRDLILQHNILRVQEKQELEELTIKYQHDIPLDKISVQQARLVLALEGPTSKVFADKATK